MARIPLLRALLVDTARILRTAIIPQRAGPPLRARHVATRVLHWIEQGLLDFPVALLGADAELEVFFRYAVPVFIHHHDGQQVADRPEEEAVEVMLDVFADRVAEDVQDDLADDEEEDAEGEVAQRPAVLQRVGDEQDLQRDVDGDAERVDDVDDDEEADCICRAEPRPALERQQADGEGDEEHGHAGKAQQPD